MENMHLIEPEEFYGAISIRDTHKGAGYSLRHERFSGLDSAKPTQEIDLRSADVSRQVSLQLD